LLFRHDPALYYGAAGLINGLYGMTAALAARFSFCRQQQAAA